MDMLKDVGRGYYCEYYYLLPLNFEGCIATKRTSCMGCKAHHRELRTPSKLMIQLKKLSSANLKSSSHDSEGS